MRLDFEVATTGDLRARGFTRADVAAAVSRGALRHVRRGWYATAGTDPRVVRAVRLGGAAGCVTGTTLAGLWEPPAAGLHLSLSRDAHPPSGRHPLIAGDIVTHWTGDSRLSMNRGTLGAIECLRQVIGCQPPDFAFAIVESALACGLLSTADLARVTAESGPGDARTLAAACALSGSGTESLFKFRILPFVRLELRQQVHVPGVGRTDFMIGDRLLVEIDSRAHHGGDAQRRRDLARDAIAAGLGYFPVRFDSTQVLHDWATVESTVLSIVERREHLDFRRVR